MNGGRKTRKGREESMRMEGGMVGGKRRDNRSRRGRKASTQRDKQENMELVSLIFDLLCRLNRWSTSFVSSFSFLNFLIFAR